MAVRYHVEVFRKNISAMLLRGDGKKFQEVVTVQMLSLARRKTPIRSGELKNKHRYIPIWGGPYNNRRYIENYADHAVYVHEGTSGVSGSPYLYLPAGGPSTRNSVSPYQGYRFKARKKAWVNGQNANPWLDNACTEVAMRYGAIVYRAD